MILFLEGLLFIQVHLKKHLQELCLQELDFLLSDFILNSHLDSNLLVNEGFN